MARKPISKKLRFQVLDRDGFRCRYCGARGETINLHIDHVIAVANGGTNDFENLLTACADCNLGKGASELRNAPSDGEPLDCPFSEGWPQDIVDPVFAIFGEWAVTGYGIENLSHFYPIDKDRLAEVRMGTNLSDWLAHLAEKEWAARDFDSFVRAFRYALVKHRVSYRFDLEASVADAMDDASDIASAVNPAHARWYVSGK